MQALVYDIDRYIALNLDGFELVPTASTTIRKRLKMYGKPTDSHTGLLPLPGPSLSPYSLTIRDPVH